MDDKRGFYASMNQTEPDVPFGIILFLQEWGIAYETDFHTADQIQRQNVAVRILDQRT